MNKPTILYRPGKQPTELLATIKAGNAYFHYERTPLWEALVYERPLDKPNKQQAAVPYCKLTLKHRIPENLILQAHAFFTQTLVQCGTEALLLIYYDPNTASWLLDAPIQNNTPGSVSTKGQAAPGDHLEVGTMHSHPGSAFHSGTDIQDETTLDGIHLVFGHVQRHTPDVIGVISIRGTRFTINPYDVITNPWTYPTSWEERLQNKRGNA